MQEEQEDVVKLTLTDNAFSKETIINTEKCEIQAHMKEYFRQKFQNHIRDKIHLKGSSTMRALDKDKTAGLGTFNSSAVERLKYKLEQKSLENYHKVLEDVRSQLTFFDPKRNSPEKQIKLQIKQSEMLKKISVSRPS